MKNLIFFVFFFSFFSCDKKGKIKTVEIDEGDSVSYYLNKIKDVSSLENDRKIYNERAYNIIVDNKNTSKNRKALDEIVNNFFNQNDWLKYEESSKQLLNKSSKSKDSIYMAKALRYLGNCFYKRRIIDSSYYYYLKSEKIFYRLKDDENYSIVLLKKGIVQLEINDFIGADKSLTIAYSVLKNTSDKQRIYASLTTLGSISSELKEYDRAISYYAKALEFVKANDLKNDDEEANCLNNLGLVYREIRDYKKSIFYFEKALLQIGLKKNNPELYSSIIDNLAYSKLKSNQIRGISKLFFESLKIRESVNFSTNKVLSYNHLSEYFFRINDKAKAKIYSTRAIQSAKDSKIPIYIIASLKQASIVDKENSSKYSDEYIKLSDSLQAAERRNIDRFARIEFETDELRQANTQLSEQNRDILNYFAIAIVFGGFLFFARFQRLKARELALKQTQQQANEEIYRLIISHQNQLEEGRDLEKKRISKELHDGVLGRLFGLRLNLDGLNNFDDEETKQQRLEYLNELKLIEQDLREISHELSRENLVLINNFVAIINNLLEQQSKINKAKINTLISDKIDWENVSNTIKINLYRILQEALQNINKHAEASKINIIFNKDPKGNLIFSVEDNGKGYNTNGKKTKGIGMDNIVDRVHQCQGKIDIKSQIGKGTKIIITFPLENETINM